jgi:hypothetical protein
MRIISIVLLAASGLCAGITVASAQEWAPSYVTGLNSFVPTNPSTTSVQAFSPGFCSPPTGPSLPMLGTLFCANTGFVPLTSFASASEVSAINSQITGINAQISRPFQLTAVSAAMGDAIPNDGDRFAVRIHAAGFSGESAGAIGFSYNVTSSARLSINTGKVIPRVLSVEV